MKKNKRLHRGIIAFLLVLSVACILYGLIGNDNPGSNNAADVSMQQKTDGSKATLKGSAAYGNLPMQFIANKGQTDPQVKYIARGKNYTLFLTPHETVLSLLSQDTAKATVQTDTPEKSVDSIQETLFRSISLVSNGFDIPGKCADVLKDRQKISYKSTTLRMSLAGADKNPDVVGLDRLPGNNNFFFGKDPRKWRRHVPGYGRVKYCNVYPGIDVVYYGNNGNLEYDFIVNPGANPGKIAMEIQGMKGMEVNDGNLILPVDGGEVCLRKPSIYQMIDGKRKEVAGGYVIGDSNRVSFRVSSYIAAQPLVIDPVLNYSTYLGGRNEDYGYDIAVDSDGCTYIIGTTESGNFPTANEIQIFSGGEDVFITKLNSTGDGMIFSTYLGGNGYDTGHAICVDSLRDIYVTGITNSSNFPLENEYQGYQGNDDVFVTKLNDAGDTLLYSTYIGGASSGDRGADIFVDALGFAYITGDTYYSWPYTGETYPVVGGGYPGYAVSYSSDVFVTKLNQAGNNLVYSTCLGGTDSSDISNAIYVDGDGSAYITGEISYWSGSSYYPLKNPLFSYNGYNDAFVTKFAPAGNDLEYSTCLGGSNYDYGFGIFVNSGECAYVAGNTNSSDFPLQNPYQGGITGAFITRFNSNASALDYSTMLGGASSYADAQDIFVDSTGRIYVAGRVSGNDFPLKDPVQAYGGNNDCFVTRFNPAGTDLEFSTYLGADDDEYAYGLAVDPHGNIYLTGNTQSKFFPVLHSIQAQPGSLTPDDYDAFAVRFFEPGLSVSTTEPDKSGDPGTTVQYTIDVQNTGTADDYYNVTINGDGWQTTANPPVILVPRNTTRQVTINVEIPPGTPPGSKNAQVTVTSQSSADVSDSLTLTTTCNQYYRVQLSPALFIGSAEPGQEAQFPLLITNQGNVQETFDLTTMGTWAVRTTPSGITLNPGETAGITARVRVPVGTPSGHSTYSSVTAVCHTQPVNTSTTSLLTSADTSHGVTITSASQTVNPGNSCTYNLTVTNTGNATDSFNVTLEGGNNWPTTLMTTTITDLAKDATAQVDVQVNCPTTALGDEKDVATIKVASTSDTAKNCTGTVTSTATRLFGLTVSPGSQAANAEAGTSQLYYVCVKNEGNSRDTFTVTHSISGCPWTINCPSNVNSIEPGKSAEFLVGVAVPSGCATGDNCQVSLEIKSEGDTSKTGTCTLSTTGTSQQGGSAYGISAPCFMSGCDSPGHEIEYTLAITNTGTSTDTCDITLPAPGSCWGTTVKDGATCVGPLAPGETKDVVICVRVPDGAPCGAQSTSNVRFTSQHDGGKTVMTRLVSCADAAGGVCINPDKVNLCDVPGATVCTTLTITNEGNACDYFDISLSGGSWKCSTNTTYIGPIEPGESEEVVVTVNIPKKAGENETNMCTLRATSRCDCKESETACIVTKADSVGGLRVNPESACGSAAAGTSVCYAVLVKNTGNTEQTVSVEAEGCSWKTQVSSKELCIEAGDSSLVTITVLVPADAKPDKTDTAAITFTSASDEDLCAEVTLKTTALLNPYQGVTILPPSASKKGKPGDTLSYTFTVKNTGNDEDSCTVSIGGNSWKTTVDCSEIGSLPCGEEKKIVVTVTIPKNAKDGSLDAATVIAVSKSDPTRIASALLKSTADTRGPDDGGNPGGNKGGGGGGCFIATAAYGSYQEHHVWILRQFRDQYLLTNSFGSAFVDFYYKNSPPMAAWIAEREWARGVARVMLLPLYGTAWVLLHNPAVTVAIFGSLLITLVYYRKRRKRLTSKPALEA